MKGPVMKAINANVVRSMDAAINLAERRIYGMPDASSIKREERRKSRHALKRELQDLAFDGMKRDFVKPVEVLRTVAKNQESMFVLIPAVQPKGHRPVQVIRKRAFLRAVKETIMVALF
jgi:hypothetical protein